MADSYARHQRRQFDTIYPAIKAIKSSGCVDCGYNESHWALDFDHINPDTKHSVPGWVGDRSKIKSHTKLALFLDHVSKCCEVRCANCHRIRTRRQVVEGVFNTKGAV